MEEQKWVWLRSKDAYIEDGILKERHDKKIENYYPFDFPNLPNALAKVVDSDSALRFVKSYGLLGYSSLVDSKERRGGDPLWWVLAQASSVRFIINLIAALSENDDIKLNNVLLSECVEPGKSIFPTRKGPINDKGMKEGSYNLTFAAKRVVFRTLTSRTEQASPLKNQAVHLIVEAVNRNTQGVRLGLIQSDDKIKTVLNYEALINAIWRLIGDMAIRSQENKGIAVRICDECGTPFLATDKRQRFCPPDQFSETSLCGAKHRMRLHRSGLTSNARKKTLRQRKLK